ncbi:hypothetical protein Sango_1720000 [Sesamum angolense]|uniref:Integrase catalytic domain-containing protein n=1 Tax=Sesamum angolense TaxID=2727404 RepID=A0AAE2BS08_9LAMI|nr:hypothetical protein Sango_1720000 [Sesamum angolense]
MPAELELSNDLPDENVLVIEVTPLWNMYFDGASHKEGVGAGVVFVTSEEKLMGWLGDVELEHLPRTDNKQADALAKLASTLSMTDKEARIPILPLKEVKKENVVDFIRTRIIYHYGVPRYIITDNGKPFCNSLIDKLCQKFRFKQRNSSMYYVAANGLAEAFNKTLCNLLKKMVAKSKRDWHERIGEALWAYRTTVRTPTQATPYALVYGVEAVLRLEQQIPSLRIAIQEGLTKEENAQIQLEELEALDEKRLEAQ